jgi:hypothetical protein
VFIIPTQDNTAITVNGTLVANINRGGIYSLDVTSSNFIQSSKSSHAYHVTGTAYDVGLAVLPTISCTGSSIGGFNRSFGGEFGLVLLVRNGEQPLFGIKTL